MRKKQYNNFLDFLMILSFIALACFLLYIIYFVFAKLIEEDKSWDKKLETCELNSFDDNNLKFEFICQDGIKIFKREIKDKQWENIKEKKHCKITFYDYSEKTKTWSCDNNIIIKKEFE